jgi:hypothetical protein
MKYLQINLIFFKTYLKNNKKQLKFKQLKICSKFLVIYFETAANITNNAFEIFYE